MEIRAFTIAFAKKKAKQNRDEESALLSEMIKLQTKLQTSYSDSLKIIGLDWFIIIIINH